MSSSAEQIEGRRPVLEALRAGHPIGELFLALGTRQSGVVAEIVRLAERGGVTIREVPRRDLESRAQTRNPQGVIALAAAFRYRGLDELLDLASGSDEPPLLIALDGITDPQNLGALARSAEAAGAHGLIVPRRRAAGVTAAAVRASAGALEHLPVAQVANLPRALEELKDGRIWVVGLDAHAEATVFDLNLADEAICVVVGSEGEGLSRLVRERADQLVRIPMSGRVESLNASAAGAVVLFEIRRRRM